MIQIYKQEFVYWNIQWTNGVGFPIAEAIYIATLQLRYQKLLCLMDLKESKLSSFPIKSQLVFYVTVHPILFFPSPCLSLSLNNVGALFQT